jgi:lipopolysaccharide/colanic/teichoic acid biosynthesis glycosyltransferase
MFRIIDFTLSLIGLILLSPIFVLIFIVTFIDTGSPLFRQERIGRHENSFTLVKFRTMQKDTASVASHLADVSAITSTGSFLRKTHLDELPQLFNVLKGDMSLVGPRPALFSQERLRNERKHLGVYNVRPGITGLSQVSGLDTSTPELLAKTDAKGISSLTLVKYFKFIIATATGKGSGDAATR